MSLDYNHTQDKAMENYRHYFNGQNEKGNYGVFDIHPVYSRFSGTELYLDTFIVEYDGRDDIIVVYNGIRHESKTTHYNKLLNLHLRKPISSTYRLSHNSIGFNMHVGSGYTDLTTVDKEYTSDYLPPEVTPTSNKYHEYMDIVLLKDGSEWSILKWMNHPMYGRFYALIDLATEDTKIVREDDIHTIPTVELDVKYEYNAILPCETRDSHYTLYYKTYEKYYSTNEIGNNTVRYYIATHMPERMISIADKSAMDLPIVNGIIVDIKQFLDTNWMIIDIIPKESRHKWSNAYYRNSRYKYLVYNENKDNHDIANALYISKKAEIKDYLLTYYSTCKSSLRDDIYQIKRSIELTQKEVMALEQVLSTVTIELAYNLIETEITNINDKISELQRYISPLDNKISELNVVIDYLKKYNL